TSAAIAALANTCGPSALAVRVTLGTTSKSPPGALQKASLKLVCNHVVSPGWETPPPPSGEEGFVGPSFQSAVARCRLNTPGAGISGTLSIVRRNEASTTVAPAGIAPATSNANTARRTAT